MSPDIREDDLSISAERFNLGINNWLFVVSWGLIIGGYVRILIFLDDTYILPQSNSVLPFIPIV